MLFIEYVSDNLRLSARLAGLVTQSRCGVFHRWYLVVDGELLGIAQGAACGNIRNTALPTLAVWIAGHRAAIATRIASGGNANACLARVHAKFRWNGLVQ